MAWTVEVSERAFKSLQKIDKTEARRIRDKLREISELEDPRSVGKALKGRLSGLWRYRAGDYRMICELHDKELRVLVIEVGHRSKIYD